MTLLEFIPIVSLVDTNPKFDLERSRSFDGRDRSVPFLQSHVCLIMEDSIEHIEVINPSRQSS